MVTSSFGGKDENADASEVYVRNLRQLQQRCRKKWDQTEFWQSGVQGDKDFLLGPHQQQKRELKADPKKVDAVKIPKTPKDKVCSSILGYLLLGIIGYLQKNAPHLYETAAPLTQLVKCSLPVGWTVALESSTADKRSFVATTSIEVLQSQNKQSYYAVRCIWIRFGCMSNDNMRSTRPEQWQTQAKIMHRLKK